MCVTKRSNPIRSAADHQGALNWISASVAAPRSAMGVRRRRARCLFVRRLRADRLWPLNLNLNPNLNLNLGEFT